MRADPEPPGSRPRPPADPSRVVPAPRTGPEPAAGRAVGTTRPGDDQTPARRPRRRVAGVAAALLVAALAAAGAGVVREREARAAEAHAQAAAALDDAAARLRGARDHGRTALAGSAGRVADNAARVRLAALLVELPATEPDPDLPRAEATTWSLARVDAVTDRAARIAEATAEVRLAWDAWELDRAQVSHADAVRALADATESARTVLAGSEGRTHDDAARQVLAAVVAAAESVLGAPDPVGTSALDALAVTAGAQVDALAVAVADVVAAEEAWTAEQDRLAAEQDRLAAERAVRAGATSGGSRTPGTGTSSDRPRAGGGSAGGPAPGSASGTGAGRYDGWLSGWLPGDPVPDGWTVVVETEGGGWGGNEHGDVWDLG